jgi:hypothetical protein
MEDGLARELLRCGESLWSTVECDVKRECVIVYARLTTPTGTSLENALAESERVLTKVLDRRLEGHAWLAAVHWSGRLCRTIRPPRPQLTLIRS